MCHAGLQHAFCKAHMSSLGPAVIASACGLDWPTNLFPTVIPGIISQLPIVQMIAYKPGASQLPTYWSTPHRSALHCHCTGCAAQSRCSLSHKVSRTMLYCITFQCSILKLGSLHASSLCCYIHACTSTCFMTNSSTQAPFPHSSLHPWLHPGLCSCTLGFQATFCKFVCKLPC